MKLQNHLRLFVVVLFLTMTAIVVVTRAEAGESRDDDVEICNGVANCNDIDVDGGRGGHGGDGGEGGESNADASTGPIDNSSAGGGATVNTRSENTSLVLSGARDTAQCFTKMGIGAEGFGIFWSRSDPFCKKVRLIAGQLDRGNLAAAARLECTLKEWEEIYGHSRPRNKDGTMTEGYKLCVEDLDMTEPEGVTMSHDEYHALTVAQVSQEEYQEQAELVEYRYAQQANLIESLQQETEADDLEIVRLKARAAELEQEQEARKAVDTQQMTQFQALYEKRVAQEIEEPAQQEEPPNE